MSKPSDPPADIPLTVAHHVRDTCLCLHAQRAARALARHFDNALRGVGMTNGQFSLMMALSGPQPPPLKRISEVLGMDRTSLTAMLKPLERRGWVEVRVDERDRRGRRPVLTPEGRAALARALPIWRREHAAIEAAIVDPEALRQGLNVIAFGQDAPPSPALTPTGEGGAGGDAGESGRTELGAARGYARNTMEDLT